MSIVGVLSVHYAHVMTQLIDSDDCVLVLVDVQPGFAERIEPQTRDGILERIAFLATAARFCGVPIVASVESPERYGDLHPAVRRAARGRGRHPKAGVRAGR